MQVTLNNVGELSSTDVDQLVSLLSYRCRVKTANRLRSVLTYSFSSIGNYGIYGRVIKENDKWCYVAGQCYTSEIKCVRELILK